MNMLGRITIFFLCISLFFNALSQNKSPGRPKIGLVLSGGGAKGIAHIGVLKVLEDAGIKVDYIGGTSMGSIIGGLYAIGYSPDTLAKLITGQNWMQLLTDGYPRTQLSIEEKEISEKYIATFPITQKGIEIPQGIVEGQNITNLLTRLCSQYAGINDFSKLPVPFFCVATNIENGQKVILDKGDLPAAMRASMAIPSFFTPVEIDGQLLVDGGLIDNYPVKELRERGADIIIGVSVVNSISRRENLNSFLDIIKQSVFFYGDRNFQDNIAATDIFINPDLSAFSIMDFESGDSLIAAGEQRAREFLPRLKALADSLNTISPVKSVKLNTQPLDSIFLKEIIVEGLKNVSGKLILSKLQLQVMNRIPLAELDRAVERIYGSRFFRKVVYQLVPLEDENYRVVFHITESNRGSLGVGIHYDNENEAAILLNVVLRNLLINGSKFNGDIVLGSNPRLTASYYLSRGFKPGFLVSFDVFNTDAYFYENEQATLYLRYGSMRVGAFAQTVYENNTTFGIGPEFEWTSIKDKVSLVDFGSATNTNFSIKSFFKINTFDRFVYPTKGLKITARAEFITPTYTEIIDSLITGKYLQSNLFTFEYQQAIKPWYFMVIKPRVAFGTTFSDNPHPQYEFRLGGTNPTYIENSIKFYGLKYMQKSGEAFILADLGLQSEIYRNHFLTLNLNIGSVADEVEDWFSTGSNSLKGVGFTYGYNSMIGPIEITFSGSNINKGIDTFLNIGFWLY